MESDTPSDRNRPNTKRKASDRAIPVAPPLSPHSVAGSTTGVSLSRTSLAEVSDGKQSSGETSRMKKKQSDRLTIVKQRTLAVVVVADIVLLLALAYQMIWLNEALHAAYEDKIRDLIGFHRSRYTEQIGYLSSGSQLYTQNRSTTPACRCLGGNRDAQVELRRQLGNDLWGRGLEIGVVTDTSGIVFGTGNKLTGIGTRFDPQALVSDLYRHYPRSPDQLLTSAMIPRELFRALGSNEYGTDSEVHLELRTWANFSEAMARLAVSPLYCGTSDIHGYVILGDAWYPRQYDNLNRLTTVASSALVAIFSQTTSGVWQMQYSYNHEGASGLPDRFPNLEPYFTADQLDQYANDAEGSSGQVELGSVSYMFGTTAIPKQTLGGERVDSMAQPRAVIIYAEPIAPIRHVVTVALLWHVPFGIFMTILSFLTLWHTFRKFVNPMHQMIDSVKKKRLAEFNEHIRKLKQNRSTLRTLLMKMILVQGSLLALIFVNRSLLVSSIQAFTSATTQGRVGPFLAGAEARAMAKTVNAWTGFDVIINGTLLGVESPELRADFDARAPILNADAVYILTRESVVLASTYRQCEGLVFPEIGLIEYYSRQKNSDLKPLLTLTSWHPSNINLFTVPNWTLEDPPALIRVASAPINHIYFDGDTFVMGDLIGALVVVRILNGNTPIWDSLIGSFGKGFYGLYQWDRFHSRFTNVTSVFQTDDGPMYGMDISEGNSNLLLQGILTSYVDGTVQVSDSVLIHGDSHTVSVAPYFSMMDDVVLWPMMIDAYQVTGVSQAHFNSMLARQMAIQVTIMVVEFLTSLLALACTYWPLRQFLSTLEKAFNVPSMSEDKRQKMEEKAASLMNLNPAESTSQMTTSRQRS